MSVGIRRQGRELALKVLYSLPDHEGELEDILRDFWQNFRFQYDVLGEPLESATEPVPPAVSIFAEGIISGVADHLEKIDAAIVQFSTNWALDRMARVDLALLRLSTYELMFQPETPISVVINESVELGKRFGTKETPAFINGILDQISKTARIPDEK